MADDVLERDGLLHVRIAGVIDAAAATNIARRIHSYLDARGGGVRMLVDASDMKIYSPEGTEVLLSFMKKANPKLERAAFIAPTSQTAALQLGRMIREAGSDVRRMFVEAFEAVAWLRE